MVAVLQRSRPACDRVCDRARGATSSDRDANVDVNEAVEGPGQPIKMGNVTRMLALVVLARVVAQDEDANARMLPFHSFVAPFVAMAPNTMRRTVSDEWTAYGDTEVLQSFARLTPEKGKSVGALWSNFPVGDAAASDRLSVVLKFRISGRAPAEQRGEGVALWLAANGFTRGPSFGSTEIFHGVGILFDTRLRKVRVVASDRFPGDDPRREPNLVAADCEAGSLRYDANRDDFGHANASRARVVATSKRVRVLIDERNRNRWRVCADVDLPDRVAESATWLSSLRIGVSGATGASADVHDVLSLETFADSRAHDRHLNSGWRKFLPGGDAAPVDDARLAKIEDMVNWMTFKLEHLNHVFEHSTAAFANAVDRGGDEFGLLVADEADRLAALERVVDERLKEKIEDRFEKLQGEFDALFEEKLNHAHTGLAASLERNLHAEVSPFDGAWRTPFQVLLVAHVAFAAFALVAFYNVKTFI